MSIQTSTIQFPAYAYLFYGSGLGSQLMNFFAKALYFKETQNRSTIIAIESNYNSYRLSPQRGVLTSFFTPQFLVIDTAEQSQLHQLQQHLPQINVTEWINQAYPSRKIWNGSYHKPNITLVQLLDYRRQIFRTFNKSSLEFYTKLTQIMCPHLQFNAAAQQHIEEMRAKHDIPSLYRNGVAFHIRRGDKLKRESIKFEAADYIRKLQSVLIPKSNATTTTTTTNNNMDELPQHCFVATDDASVLNEFQTALVQLNWPCQLHSLAYLSMMTSNTINATATSKDDKNKAIADTWHFMADLYFLVEAEYFVGTFNSNVGALVAVLRGCRHLHNATTTTITESYSSMSLSHYGHSYGVDQDQWYMR